MRPVATLTLQKKKNNNNKTLINCVVSLEMDEGQQNG